MFSASPEQYALIVYTFACIQCGNINIYKSILPIRLYSVYKQMAFYSYNHIAKQGTDLLELEALLLTHPAGADAAVVGRPDEAAGEIPVA